MKHTPLLACAHLTSLHHSGHFSAVLVQTINEESNRHCTMCKHSVSNTYLGNTGTHFQHKKNHQISHFNYFVQCKTASVKKF